MKNRLLVWIGLALILVLAGCLNFGTTIEPPVQPSPRLSDQNQSDQNGLVQDLNAFAECGTAVFIGANPDRNGFNAEADAGWVCLGKNILQDCTAAKVSIATETGSTVFKVTKAPNYCLAVLEYESDSGIYANTSLQCPISNEWIARTIGDENALEMGGSLAASIFLYSEFQLLNPETDCTGTALDVNWLDQNVLDFNQLDSNQFQDQNVQDQNTGGDDTNAGAEPELLTPSDSEGMYFVKANRREFNILVEQTGFTPNELHANKDEYVILRVQAVNKRHNFATEFMGRFNQVDIDRIIEQREIVAISFAMPSLSQIDFSCTINCDATATGKIIINLER